MSEENVAIVTGLFDAVNAREFGAALAAYTDDVVLVLHADALGLDTDVSGKAAVGEWFGDWFRQFAPGYRFEVEEVRDLGERVFLVATHHGRGRASGASVTQRTAYLYSIRGDKVSRMEVWADREVALEAAGLAE